MAEEKNSWNKTNARETELEALKQIVAQTQLTETVKWGGPVYVWNNKNVVGLGAFKHFFTIWFYNGVFLTDPKKVLVNANGEKTKSLRQWRFTAMDQIDEKWILQYLHEAIQIEKDGKAIAPTQRSATYEIPEILQFFLRENNLTAQFDQFSLFKKREFGEYIAEAKQDKTKLARLEKILPMIREGVGLHDRYRKG